MSARRCIAVLLLATSLSGCGFLVPEIQEFPFDERVGQKLVQAIVTNVTCEVQDAFYGLYKKYPQTFMDDWGAQITLKLTTDEKGSVNPTINWLPPTAATRVFNLSGGLNFSSDATRINIVNSYYLVSDLKKQKCPEILRGVGPYLLQSDLKLKEWLFDMQLASGSNTVQFNKDTLGGPFKQNVLSHEVKFEVVSGGSVTPTLKLKHVQFDPTGTALSLNRTRLHDLIVTIGPADTTYLPSPKKGKPPVKVFVGPSREAADIHLSNMIGSAVGQAVSSSLRQ